jgi:membrane-associated phospholipid phosphatase
LHSMMRSPLMPFVLAVVVTLLVGFAVRMEPYFAGDVAATKLLQSVSPHPESWATVVSRLAPAPGKYYVMAVVLTAAIFVGGWQGAALIAVFLLLEQYGAESTKAWFGRPRPSRDLVAVFGNFGGYTFPSTTITFLSVTFGGLGVLALVRRNAPYRVPVMAIAFGMLLLGCAARVALGAHWSSDVLLTSLILLVWIWAASRVVLGKG